MTVTVKGRKLLLLLPLYGILLFTLCYIIAAFLYPGGSNVDRNSHRFNLMTNYWCELTSARGKNGQINPGRNVAIVGMLILASALSVFWFQFPSLFNTARLKAIVLRGAGMLSMITILFLPGEYHDTVINISGGFGLIAQMIIYHELYINHAFKLFTMGMIGLLLFFLNNYIYMTGNFLICLPVIQKISFIFFLLWIAIMNIRLYKNRISEARALRSVHNFKD